VVLKFGWIHALRWQRLPEMEHLGDFLIAHLDEIAAYAGHLDTAAEPDLTRQE
jgi:hypothetical protein